MERQSDPQALLTMTADIVAAHVSNNSVPTDTLPDLIQTVHDALASLDPSGPPRPAPAVSVTESVGQDHLVCLEDGKKLKTLRRHLMMRYGMTPEQYRAKWNLPADYPMVAPAYAERRRSLAKQIGLGTSANRRRETAEAE
ncbi:MucR family transcriptional regulator [Sphingomonas gellani]|nr:MucR family transcriptional regulator [Sphingomonas gellani]